MNRTALRPAGKAGRSGSAEQGTGASRRVFPPRTVLVLVVAAALLVSIGQAVAIGTHVQATLGDASNTLYASSSRQLQVATFFRVVVAAVAFWLIVFGRRVGFIIAIAYGVLTVLLYAISVTTPSDPGPSLAPAWLYALGMVAAVVMTLAGAMALRRE